MLRPKKVQHPESVQIFDILDKGTYDSFDYVGVVHGCNRSGRPGFQFARSGDATRYGGGAIPVDSRRSTSMRRGGTGLLPSTGWSAWTISTLHKLLIQAGANVSSRTVRRNADVSRGANGNAAMINCCSSGRGPTRSIRPAKRADDGAGRRSRSVEFCSTAAPKSTRGPGVSADGPDGGGPGRPSGRRVTAGRARCRRECADANRAGAGLGPAEFGARLRPRHRHRARRAARARLAYFIPGATVSAPVRRARRPARSAQRSGHRAGATSSGPMPTASRRC